MQRADVQATITAERRAVTQGESTASLTGGSWRETDLKDVAKAGGSLNPRRAVSLAFSASEAMGRVM